ncbi:uncharacterized protein N7518_001681 [Penicillium psychrosexuale]|uniref:uncharacterized protein n=1 Tax=Penicillium psychrosexuale TaxID=1002107 RepID=UPI002544E3C0|nr:uncharacterized protein N7518_001681 [Penicillium psychrosexuale]KAJ5799613.1 hypothetical protein N7518_001681 [Penicillium psychrosexuale]
MVSPQDPPSDACEILTISAKNFTEHASFAESVKGIICAAKHYQLLTVTDVPLGWEDSLWEADEDLPANRKTYDPITGLLRVSIMPTNGHDVASGWLSRTMVRWTRAGLTIPQEEDILYTMSDASIDFKYGVYRGWRKQPDAAFRIGGLNLPTLVVEVGWSEGYPDLLDDMNKLLVGGNGDIRAVIIIKFTQQGVNVSGFLEVYRLNSQGIPYLAQDETVFPTPQGQAAAQQQVRVTRSELFGKFLVPGMTGADILPLDVDWLRSICRSQIALMGLVPV